MKHPVVSSKGGTAAKRGIKLAKIEAVIFDLGGVLIDVHLEPLRRRLERRGLPDLAEEIRRQPQAALLNSGRIGPQDFYRWVEQRYALGLTFEEFREAWCSIFSPRPAMEELVRQLAGRVRLGLLSDTDPMHWGHLCRHYRFLELFPRPVLSFQVGAVKPLEVMYQAAAESVGTAAERCFYTDDLPENVEGARRAGMRAVLFESPAQIEQLLKEENLLETA